MGTKTVRVRLEVPEGISRQTRQAVQEEAEKTAVLGLWKAGEFSTRRAAEELGLSYRELLDLLATRGIPVLEGELDLQAIEEADRQFNSDHP